MSVLPPGAVYTSSLGSTTPLYPMLYGGGQERNLRPGTENTGMIAGLGQAAVLVNKNLQSYHNQMKEVTKSHKQTSLRQPYNTGSAKANGAHF